MNQIGLLLGQLTKERPSQRIGKPIGKHYATLQINRDTLQMLFGLLHRFKLDARILKNTLHH
jgi:hypothetical protein